MNVAQRYVRNSRLENVYDSVHSRLTNSTASFEKSERSNASIKLLEAISVYFQVRRKPRTRTLGARCHDILQVTRYIMGHKSSSVSLGILGRASAKVLSQDSLPLSALARVGLNFAAVSPSASF